MTEESQLPEPQDTKSPTFEDGTIAAIDIGSNSFHLITARITNGALQPLVMDKQIVRLADGLNEDGVLSEEAMERGLEVLKSFALTIKDIAPESVRVVATHTLRRASNAHKFLRRARDFMPAPVEIISGDEEARLIYQGVAHTTHHDGQRLVVDIGGGSTEFAIGKAFSILQLSSQPMGCVVFTKRFFASGKINKKTFNSAVLAAQQRLEIISPRFTTTGWDIALGSSGTVKAVHQYLRANMESFDGTITLDLLKSMREQLINIGKAEKIEGVDEHRRKVLPAGLAILIAVFQEFEMTELLISESALREGVLYELPDRMRHHDIRERTTNSLMLRYDVDTQQVDRVIKTADHLMEQYAKTLKPRHRDTAREFLRWSVYLHEIGLQINRRGIQHHSSYIVSNAELPGFSNEEQALLATMLSAYRKKFQKKNFADFNILPNKSIVWLVAILRLAILLNVRRRDNFLPDFQVEFKSTKLALSFPDGWLVEHPLFDEDLKSEASSLEQNDIELNWH